MKLVESDTVQWQEGDAHHVGRVMVVYDPHEPGQVVAAEDGIVFDSDVFSDDSILVKHSHTGQLEFIPKTDLLPYPSKPIPTP